MINLTYGKNRLVFQFLALQTSNTHCKTQNLVSWEIASSEPFNNYYAIEYHDYHDEYTYTAL